MQAIDTYIIDYQVKFYFISLIFPVKKFIVQGKNKFIEFYFFLFNVKKA